MNLEVENPEEWQKEEQERIDSAEPLTEEQQQEKESLLKEVSLSRSLPYMCYYVHAPITPQEGDMCLYARCA